MKNLQPPRAHLSPLDPVWALLVLLLAGGCEERRTAEPKPSPSLPAPTPACSDQPLAPFALPLTVAGYCISADRDIHYFGAGTPTPLDVGCQKAFGEDCRLPRNLGLEQLKGVHFVSQRSAESSIRAWVMEFSRTQGAYSFFTHRVSSRRSELSALEVPGRAVLGVGWALVWRGQRVVELRYSSESETPREMERRGTTDLAPFAREVAIHLGGRVQDPEVVQLLDKPGRAPLGTRLEPDELLGLVGSGSYASAEFPDASHPHVVLAALREDEDSARDLMRLLRLSGPSSKSDRRDIYSIRHTNDGQAPQTWFFRREGNAIFGVGPLPSDLDAVRTAQELDEQADQWRRFAIDRLLEFP